MYQFAPSPNLLPVMPGTRLYSVDPFFMTLDDDEIYAEGVVITEDSLLVYLDGEAYELGEGLFLSRDEALRWIEQNHKASILDHLLGAFSTAMDRLSGTNHRLPGRSVREGRTQNSILTNTPISVPRLKKLSGRNVV